MNSQKNKKLYESFHKVTKKQNKIIDKTDYTQGVILRIVDELIDENSVILDIGCGTGSKTLYLAKRTKFVVGIDISENAIESCKRFSENFNMKNVKFSAVTLEDFSTNLKFDLILLIEVIEHLYDDKQALIKVNKLLKKNGVLVLSTPSINAPLHRMGLLTKFDKRVGHLRRYKMSDLEERVQSTGFKIVNTYKTEGLLRNLIFTTRIGGILLKVINRSKAISYFIEQADKLFLSIFGESDLIIVAKPK